MSRPRTVAYVLGAASIVIGLFAAVVDVSKPVKRLNIALVLLFFVISLLCWAYAGSAIPLNVVNLLQSTLNLSIPLVLGALAGCMCERSGVINIAIEGQLLLGAFAAAVVASAFGAVVRPDHRVAGRRAARRAAGGVRDPFPGRPDHPRRGAQRAGRPGSPATSTTGYSCRTRT